MMADVPIVSASEWGCEHDRHELGEAMRMWKLTYQTGKDDEASFIVLRDLAIASEPDQKGLHDDLDVTWDRVKGAAMRWQVYARWAQDGYPVLQASRSLASAMMCSETTGLEAGDVRLPWRAVMATVPDGLLVEGTRVFNRILLDGTNAGRPEEGIRLWIYSTSGIEGGIRGFAPPGSTDEALVAMLRGHFTDERTSEGRIIHSACRYIAGLLVALQYGDNFSWREIRAARKRSPWSRGEPAHRVAMFGRPIATDFSRAVIAYISEGKRSAPPSVQSLVRGHYKRQAFGVDRAARKVIWIEPYWRGPENAPILARPIRVQ